MTAIANPPAVQLVALQHDAPLVPNLTAGVVIASSYFKATEKVTLSLTAVRVLITNALAYGGTLLAYLPNTNGVLIGARMNLTGLKDGVAVTAATQPRVGVGTATASNATLSGTMDNILNGGNAAGLQMAATLSAALSTTWNANATSTANINFTPSATTGVYLNATAAPATDGYVDFTGTIDLYYEDLGQ